MRRLLALLLLGVCAAPAAAARPKSNHMLRVITPVGRSTVPAHPHVNVIVRFSATEDGLVPDPTTFRARRGRTDLTARFRPIVENGATVGMRAELSPPAVRLGRRAANRLRFEVRSQARTGGPGPRTVRDVDRVRFRALEAANQPPVAALVPPSELIFPDVELQFDGSASSDPELDEVTYAWDFGDGGSATEVTPLHTYEGGSGDVTVQLTVSDGALSDTDSVTLIECPEVDDGRTPGILNVDGTAALEFATVAPGGSSTIQFTVTNTDSTPTSQLRVALEVTDPAFHLDPPALDLGPGESAPVNLVFSPTAPGHRSGDVVMVASASNRCALHLLGHGYGGTGSGTGPTMAGTPVFYNNFFGIGAITGTAATLPGGVRVAIDNMVHVCQSPGNGPGTGDLCVDNGDCAANGGTCNQSLNATFDPIDMCSDGRGGLYILSDEGTFTDPTPGDDDLSVSVLRLDLDDAGARTGARILSRVTSGTTQFACDGIAPGGGGRLFVSEFHELNLPNCFRSEQESLLPIHKGNGAKDPPLLSRIDAAEGLDACEDDIDLVFDLNVTPDGLTVFASLEDAGLYQLRPSFRLITPDIHEAFQLHPDGDIIYVPQPRNVGTTGLINVYRLSPQQAATGALRLADLTPCATFKVPRNRGGAQDIGSVFLPGEHSYAVGPAADGSLDGTLLVSFLANGGVGDRPPSLAARLRVQGTVAFALPAGSASCSALGLVNLDLIDQLTF